MKLNRRIVHLTTVHNPFDTRIFHKECKSIAAAGYDVTLIAFDKEVQEQRIGNVRLKLLKRPKGRLARLTAGLFTMFQVAVQQKADIYHFHDPELIPVGRLLKRKNNIVIYDIHEDYETGIRQKRYLVKPLNYIASYIYRLMEKPLISPFALCLAEKYYSDKYPNGQTILNYPTLGDETEDEQKDIEVKSSKHQRLLYTGNVTADRGAFHHARIPSLSPSLLVQFVGHCSGVMADKILQIAGSGKDRVNIMGVNSYVPREEIDKYYAEQCWLAGLALFPPTEHYKKKELTKFFEYMQAGLPIICSDFPVWKNFVNEHRCGIAVDPNNDEEVLNAIKYLQDHPEQAAKMGSNGQNVVKQELNWGTQEKVLLSWYAKLLAQKGENV